MALNIEKTKFEILKEISNTHCEIKCCKCNATRVGRTNYYKKITEISCDTCFVNSLIGQKFNKLTILEFHKNEKPKGNSNITCICDCGDIKKYKLSSVLIGNTKSCGCLSKDHRATKYNYNIDLFKTYSPERNYIIGLLVTDGSMSPNLQRCYIALKEEDSAILKEIS